MLRDEHLAEGVIQAAFLVLARRAGSMRRPVGWAEWPRGLPISGALSE